MWTKVQEHQEGVELSQSAAGDGVKELRGQGVERVTHESKGHWMRAGGAGEEAHRSGAQVFLEWTGERTTKEMMSPRLGKGAREAFQGREGDKCSAVSNRGSGVCFFNFSALRFKGHKEEKPKTKPKTILRFKRLWGRKCPQETVRSLLRQTGEGKSWRNVASADHQARGMRAVLETEGLGGGFFVPNWREDPKHRQAWTSWNA